MREIKFRYTWKRIADGHIYQSIVPIECLERKGDVPFLGNPLWKLIGRDEWIGKKDINKIDIFENDIMKGSFGTGTGTSSTKYKEFFFSIGWHEHHSEFGLNMPKNYGRFRFHPRLENCEVVGDIHQNKNLLK